MGTRLLLIRLKSMRGSLGYKVSGSSANSFILLYQSRPSEIVFEASIILLIFAVNSSH